MAAVKCQICIVKDCKTLMTQLPNKRYVHTEGCLEIHKQREDFKRTELEKWHRLFKYLLGLHDLLILPKANIVRLQALRNGEDIKNGERVKKYKMGATYELMLDAYMLAENDIKWCIKNTLKGSNDVKAINYCISIMIGKLNEAWLREKNRKRQQQELNDSLPVASVEREERIYRSKKVLNDDITDFL